MFRKLAASAIALVLAATPVHAQWTYAFTGTFDFGNGAQTISFVHQTLNPITGPLQTLPSQSCSVTPNPLAGQTYQCEPMSFDPNGFGTGVSYIGASFAGFDVGTGNPAGGGTAFYFFAVQALSTAGTYTQLASVPSVPNPLYDPNFVCDTNVDPNCEDERLREYNNYGSAGNATLTVTNRVTNVVPEPGTWALMAVGLVGLTAAARRRHPKTIA